MANTKEKIQTFNQNQIKQYLLTKRNNISKNHNSNSEGDTSYNQELIIIQVNPTGRDLVLFGGMGYVATLDYLERILKFDLTKIRSIYCLQATSIPDRTKVILNRTKHESSNQNQLIKKVEGLLGLLDFVMNEGQADLIFLCNTIHVFLPSISIDPSRFKLHSLLTYFEINQLQLSNQTILGLYTIGTKKTKLYKNILKNSIIELDSKESKFLMDLIYLGVKCNNKEYLYTQKESLISLIKKYNTHSILFGCTEILNIFETLDLFEFKHILDPVLLTFNSLTKSNK
ncbi:MAG: hypothetical protein ACRCXZ_01250 [Patescibacteria group bacterium]